ncbi:DNA methyltransferase [Dasania marina]|uniref:DNA methyltransferase n=1 Tax=Dasania marina TaxID=471499 RepID=UPI0030DCB8BD|tara:strand:+ start:12803 stop:15871 length:3069 start_codon:yes stop_codon:yes gene_type:complete
MSESYNKLISTLQTLFEMDKADLDFGIYRIMNQKRDEINRFLEQDLLPQVKQAFAEYSNDGNQGAQAELGKLIQTLSDAGMDPEQSPKVVELRQQLASAVDVTALENDVFSKLHTFLSRYYDKGDFISQRRYKADTYAIPYEGEEVKLYWANHDQYYIKSSEHLRDYAFIAKDTQDNDKPVRIKLVEADTEKDNVKAKSGEERRFVLDEQTPLSIEDGELLIHFNFIPVGKKKQTDLNKAAVETIFKQTAAEFSDWLTLLKTPAPTEKDAKRTILEKHLNDYTARNTFDYFIHKDLGGFLNRELDFYIKNEVMHLDDIDDASFELTQQQLRKIKILRSIAQKIIRMLAQIENFQKKLWLKKKFVVETNYFITLDKVPESLIGEIVGNKNQLNEWEQLFNVDLVKLNDEYISSGVTKFRSYEKYMFLIVDTKHFDNSFKERLISSIDNVDSRIDGVLVNSDNYQALNSLSHKYKEIVDCIYIDPPYNTDASPILYKNGYQTSSWVSLMESRIKESKILLKPKGILVAAIDDAQQRELNHLISSELPGGILGTFSVRSNPSGRPMQSGYSVAHEYLIYGGKSSESQIGRMHPTEKQLARFSQIDDDGSFEWRNLRREGSNSDRSARKFLYYPIFISGEKIRVPNITWDDNNESWALIEEPGVNEIIVYPDNDKGIEKTWRWGCEKVKSDIGELKVRKDRSGKDYIYYKRRANSEGIVAISTWFDAKYSSTEHGSNLLKNMFGANVFSFPKSIHAVEDAIFIGGGSRRNSVILDYFAGSGTTAHATINLNRKDQGGRKYCLVEMGKYFSDILVPRVKKSVYTDKWVDGKPVRAGGGVSHFVKYFSLEGYEDTIENIRLKSNSVGQNQLQTNFSLKEDYMLGYWLDVESADSPSLLNIEQFEDPFNYKLNIGSGSVGATTPTTVDLVETFNYLIGLTVQTMDVIRGFKIVTGTNPKGESVLVVWRNLKEKDNAALEEFLDKQGYNPRDTEFEHIYVNGDHTLEDPQSKVKMTEIEFKRLMFDVKDV